MVEILFIEDELDLQEIFLESTKDLCKAQAVSSAEEALVLISKPNTQFDIAVVDIGLPKMSGVDFIPHLLSILPNITIISTSATNEIHLVVETMKRGAKDFLSKPFNLTKLIDIISRTISQLKNKKPAKSTPCQIVGQSCVMQDILQQVKTIAPFNSSVLITGETGTGKELVAQNIHFQSNRSQKPFVAINCAAIPEQLLEDELFGHIKGAFTGAQNSREGRLEQANGGTLFLDEIGDMNLALQAKLLRVLQERQFEKLGSSKTIDVDIRIVAATSANLEERIEKGTFRPDLYYRLNTINLQMPSLKERQDDIINLAEYFLLRFCGNNSLPMKILEADAQNTLLAYNWPGNVRQLQNTMERAAILSGNSLFIESADLPTELKNYLKDNPFSANTNTPSSISNKLSENASNIVIEKDLTKEGMSFETLVTDVERELLCESLRKTSGNKLQAAKLLNLKRTTFLEKLKRLGISDNFIVSNKFLNAKYA